MAFGGIKLGQYRHFKKGALYIGYDTSINEETQKEHIHYIRLSDGAKFNRPFEEFNDDVSNRLDKQMEQKQRYKLLSKDCTFYIHKSVAEEAVAAVKATDEELGSPAKPAVPFKTMKEFLAANGIPLPLKLGDEIILPEEHGDVIGLTQRHTISAITEFGVYVPGEYGHAFVSWELIGAITLKFN
jgi:hypothetical protein